MALLDSLLLSLADIPTLLVFMTVLLALVFWSQSSRGKKLPPGPTPLPILGNMLQLLASAKRGDTPEYLKNLRSKYGDIVLLKLGPIGNFVILYTQKLIQKAFVERGDEFRFRPVNLFIANHIFHGKGAIFSNGAQHSAVRKFTLTALRDFGVGRSSLETAIQTEGKLLCEAIQTFKGQPHDLRDLMRKTVGNVMSGIIFNHRYDHDDPEFVSLLNDVETFFKVFNIGVPENSLPFLRHLPNSKFKQISGIFKRIENAAREHIRIHRESFDSNNIRDFVDFYIQSEGTDNEHINEDNLFRVIVDLFNAGMDTTSLSMIWTILHLVNNPRVQEKCRNEILEVAGEDRLVGLTDRPNLPYLQATINEMLRISSIAPQTIPHTVLQDTEFEGLTIPKDSIIVGHLHTIFTDPENWENPTEFRPERFLDDNGKLDESMGAFMPFGKGPRSCIGKYLARMELLIFVGTLLQRFEFKFPKGVKSFDATPVQTGITSQPTPFNVCAIPR